MAILPATDKPMELIILESKGKAVSRKTLFGKRPLWPYMKQRFLDWLYAPIFNRLTDVEYLEGGTHLQVAIRFFQLRLTAEGRAELAEAQTQWNEWLERN